MIDERLQRLYSILDSYPRLLVAYSGGVDSAFLLRAAVERLGSNVLGVIADSPSLPRVELAEALALATRMNSPVEVIKTDEFSNSDYLSNPSNRCYFCKSALFEKMEALALLRKFPVLAYGENLDDSLDIRPGTKAAQEFQVRAPLREAALSKRDIRELSKNWNLPTADKPASPCLSSRIPHGTAVTLEALSAIESGESAIRALGFRIFRLRHHGARARIEFAADELPRALEEPLRSGILEAARSAGYSEAAIDLKPYRGVPTLP